MNVTLEKTGNVEGKIVVNVSPADYADKVKKELKKFSETHVIPGFRKGHMPMAQLRQRFGKSVKSDVINDLVYKEVFNYIRDNKINILGEPLPLEVQQIDLDDKDYTFAYEVGLSPEINAVADKSVTIPFYTIEVSDDMMAEQDKALRERFGAQVPGEEVEDRALVKGAIMELNEDGSIKETEDAIQVISGIVGPSFFKSEDEKAKFMGKHVGDKVVFNPWNTCNGNPAELSSMLNIDKDKAADVKGDFEFAISEIIVLRPAEHDQDFYDNVFGKDKVADEEQYNENLKKMIANALIGNSHQLFANDVHKYYVEAYKDTELPAEFLKKWLIARNEELNEENINEEYDKMHDSLIWQLVKGDLAQKLDVKVEEDDILDYAKSLAYQQFAQYGITNLDDETITGHARSIIANDEYRRRIAETVADNKLFEAIQNAVNTDNKTVSLDEFKEIAAKA